MAGAETILAKTTLAKVGFCISVCGQCWSGQLYSAQNVKHFYPTLPEREPYRESDHATVTHSPLGHFLLSNHSPTLTHPTLLISYRVLLDITCLSFSLTHSTPTASTLSGIIGTIGMGTIQASQRKDK